MFVVRNLIVAIATIINYVLWAYMWILIIRALLSWVSPDPYNPIVRTIYAVTEPVLSPLRRKLPLYAGSNNFSVIVALLIIFFIQLFVVQSLRDLAMRMS
jgi:YggT family protein